MNNSGFHREDGPAIITNDGDRFWFNKSGKLHREDGPAVEWINGRKEYWINGSNYIKTEWKKYNGM